MGLCKKLLRTPRRYGIIEARNLPLGLFELGGELLRSLGHLGNVVGLHRLCCAVQKRFIPIQAFKHTRSGHALNPAYTRRNRGFRHNLK